MTVNCTKVGSPGTTTGYYHICTIWPYYGWHKLYSESNKCQGSLFNASICWFNLLLTWQTDCDQLLSDLSMPIYMLYKYSCTFSFSQLWRYSYGIHIMATVQAVNMATADSPTSWSLCHSPTSQRLTCWRGPLLTHGKYKSQLVLEFSNFVHQVFIL